VPQETILFNGARYHQRLKVELEPGATWLGWEISRLGRSARGEQFLQGHWQSRTEVWQQGQLVWLDPQSVPGNPEVWASPHGLYGQPIVASLAWVGPEVEPELVHQVRILGQEILARSSDASSPPLSPLSSPPLSPQAKSEMGATRLRSGLLCRYRGNSSLEAKQWFWAVWNLLRQTYQGKSACYPRIWPRQTTKI
jgi:urease accessory protein